KNQAGFQSEVRALHLKNQLNYKDKHFQVYFFPIPTKNFTSGDNYKYGWSNNYNPITQNINKNRARNESRYVKMSIYTTGSSSSNAFAERMANELKDLYSKQKKLLHIRSVIFNMKSGKKSPIFMPVFDGQASYENARTHE